MRDPRCGTPCEGPPMRNPRWEAPMVERSVVDPPVHDSLSGTPVLDPQWVPPVGDGLCLTPGGGSQWGIPGV